MPKITIPPTTTGNDQTPTEEVNRAFFSAKAPSGTVDSGMTLNGFLHYENLNDALTYRDFKRGAFCFGESLGATDNVDYFPELFPTGVFIADGATKRSIVNPDEVAYNGHLPEAGNPYYHLNFPIRTDFFQPIPGLNKTFYNPYEKALVIFTWNMSLAIDGYVASCKNPKISTIGGTGGMATNYRNYFHDNHYGAWVIFKLFDPDGEEVGDGVRKSQTAFRTVLPKEDRPASGARRGAQNDLYYSGHLVFELTKPGWYTGGVQLGYAAPPKSDGLFVKGGVVTAGSGGGVGEAEVKSLYTYSLERSAMGVTSTAAQVPGGMEYLANTIGENFAAWGSGIRQARVRVRSIRNILFKL